MAVAALTSEHLSGADLGIDQLLFSEPPGASATMSPGLIAVGSASTRTAPPWLHAQPDSQRFPVATAR